MKMNDLKFIAQLLRSIRTYKYQETILDSMKYFEEDELMLQDSNPAHVTLSVKGI